MKNNLIRMNKNGIFKSSDYQPIVRRYDEKNRTCNGS